MKQVSIKLTSAIGISGTMYRAGSIIHVSDEAAKDLLRRDKGVLATADDEEGEDFPDLSKMSKAKLLEAAEHMGLASISEANTKAEIIHAIEAAADAQRDGE